MSATKASTLLIHCSNNPGSQPLITLDFPVPLQQRVINALKADPNSIDLRVQSPHFYTLGARILDLFEDDDIVDVLTEVSFGVSVHEQHRAVRVRTDAHKM